MMNDYHNEKMNIYYSDNGTVEKVPMETAKDIIMDAGKIINEICGILNELSDNLVGKPDPIDVIQPPDIPESSMMDALIKQRAKAEYVRQLAARLKERMY